MAGLTGVGGLTGVSTTVKICLSHGNVQNSAFMMEEKTKWCNDLAA